MLATSYFPQKSITRLPSPAAQANGGQVATTMLNPDSKSLINQVLYVGD